ncbi:phenylalanyl-tRNA synthetase beta chain [Nematocida sp. LUAm3]|nr:phenylalanyl-tRNA synthetase beta chain [Nematocida sp. LUAm3]KAI5174765.1 phenylalanyl-tRNA synthetase beta chain [Nematocida sp. LUAm2]KAI5177824.1 phenylalanyl-tRNA synthetase beta chain [Nematocida sp. LUAm1]
MPGISISRKDFLSGIKKDWNDEEVEETLFNFGLEVEEVDTDADKYKIDVPANRYDLLCLRGVVNGISEYIGSRDRKNIEISKKPEEIEGPRPKSRPFVKVGVLYDVDLTNGAYQDLIEFQDKLHHSLGHNRELMAIGTHNYDVTEHPYKYTVMKEEDISFVPLNQNRLYTRKELDLLYKSDSKLKAYLNLSRDEEGVPVVLDGKNRILSLPPLINSEFSKITPETKNILLEVTGTDERRVSNAFSLIVHLFSSPSGRVEELSLETEEKKREPIHITKKEIEKELHLSLSWEETKKYLYRMMYDVEVEENNEDNWKLLLFPSPLRTDILHLCDVIEDLAISYGYNNFSRVCSANYSIGQELPINAISSNLRRECGMVGYTEMFTMALLSKNDSYGYPIKDQILVKNPKSSECEVVRQALSPSLLKCIYSNQHHLLPIRIFEISDVVVFDSSDIGVRNDRRLCMVIAGMTSGLEEIHEAFDVVMKRIGLLPKYIPSDVKPFIPGRSSLVEISGQTVGSLGIVSLDVLSNQKIPHICSVVEISLTSILPFLPTV